MDMDKIIRRIHQLPAREQREMLDLISAIEKQKQVEGARKSFMGFTKAVWPDFIEGNHHKKMAECFDRIISGDLKRLIICMPPRHRLALDTEIPTVSGWKTIQEIKKGDYVFDTYGKPTLVMGKSEIYKEQLYEVEANDGSKVKCDGSHLWTVRFHGGHFQTYSTEMLYRRQCGENVVINHGVEKIRAGKACSRPPMLPVNQAVEYPEKELPVDPYVLGVWIGDGSSYGGSITSHDDDQKFLRPEIERRGFVTKDRTTRQTFGIDDLTVRLKKLDLIKNKHIPEMYLTASIEQRMDLLRGLMDTDGNVAKSGQCFFAQKKRHIIDKFRELLNSLGIKNFLFASEAKIGNKSYGIHYKVTFYKKDCCLMPRKNIRTKDPVEHNKARTITIEKTKEFGYVQCLEVANTDGLFQVGRGYLVSHNTKSEFTSHLLPAYYLGHNPKGKIIQASHTADLSIAFGRKTRNLMDTSAYQEIFPDVSIAADAKAAGRWGTNKGGEYYAVGVGGALAGRGANLMIIDDPVSEQDANMALSNPEIYENIYEWYQTGPRQRLQPLGATVICMTRWSQSDLVGKVLKKAQNPDSLDKWEVIEFPAILPSGRPLWPEFWSLESLQATKAALSVPQWNAQYMQAPTSEEGALIKRDWWKLWPEHKKHPKFEAIIQSWDTAFLKTERSNYSACTTWGLFYPDPDAKVPNVLLLDAMKAKLEFPQLKKKAMDLYNEWQPDSVVVEAKAAGAPLIYELRAMGIPIKEFTPSRGQDKIVRVNSITDIFASGMVWRPDSRWSEEVADECAAFPNGESDDIVDTCLAADTKIYTARGLKLIEDIAVGDLVMTHLGRFRKVTATGSRVSDHINKLKAATLDEISITGNHPVLAADIRYDAKGVRTVSMVNWNRADELLVRPQYQFRRGDRLVTSARAAPHHAVILPASSEVMQDIDLTSYTDCNYDDVYVYGRTTKINRKVKLNYDFGFLCGLFIAEGCVVYKREIAHGISISCDKGILEKLQGSFLELLGIKTVLKLGSGCHVLTGLSKPLGQFFETFGRLAENKIVPEWCFSGGSDFICGFLDGYGHGDGSYFKNQLKITSTSLSAMWGARLLAARAGFNGKINLSKPAGKRNVFGHHCQCLDAYSLNFITTKGNNGIGADTVYGPAFYVTKNERIDEPTVVYNISVEEDESYVTTGGVVHNCSQALLLMRQGGWIGSSNDNWDDDSGGEWWKHRKADYY